MGLNVPASQSWQVEAEEAPFLRPYVPSRQSLHADAPSVSLNVPSPQSRHDDAFVAPSFSLALPFSHLEQAEAEAEDHVPALQSAHDPTLAADACPAAQPLQVVEFEAANVPALQSSHTEAASLSEN